MNTSYRCPICNQGTLVFSSVLNDTHDVVTLPDGNSQFSQTFRCSTCHENIERRTVAPPYRDYSFVQNVGTVSYAVATMEWWHNDTEIDPPLYIDDELNTLLDQEGKTS